MGIIENEFDSILDKGDMTEIGDMITRIAVSTDLRKLITEKFTDVVFGEE